MHHCDAAAEPHCAQNVHPSAAEIKRGAETQVNSEFQSCRDVEHTAAIVDGCNRKLNTHKQQPSLRVDVNPGQRRVNPLLAGVPVRDTGSLLLGRILSCCSV